MSNLVKCNKCGKAQDAGSAGVTRHCGKFYCLTCAPPAITVDEAPTSWGGVYQYWRKGGKPIGRTCLPSHYTPA